MEENNNLKPKVPDVVNQAAATGNQVEELDTSTLEHGNKSGSVQSGTVTGAVPKQATGKNREIKPDKGNRLVAIKKSEEQHELRLIIREEITPLVESINKLTTAVDRLADSLNARRFRIHVLDVNSMAVERRYALESNFPILFGSVHRFFLFGRKLDRRVLLLHGDDNREFKQIRSVKEEREGLVLDTFYVSVSYPPANNVFIDCGRRFQALELQFNQLDQMSRNLS